MTYVQAAAADKKFAKRLDQISRRHSKLAKGYLMSVNHDGLVVAKPKRAGLRFPLRGLILAAMLVIGFKAFALAYLGVGSYDERIGRLAGGTTAEKAAAWVMQADPATRYVSGYIEPYIK